MRMFNIYISITSKKPVEGNKLKYLNVLQVFPFINLATLVYVDALKEATNCIAQSTAQMTFLIIWIAGEYLVFHSIGCN